MDKRKSLFDRLNDFTEKLKTGCEESKLEYLIKNNYDRLVDSTIKEYLDFKSQSDEYLKYKELEREKNFRYFSKDFIKTVHEAIENTKRQ